MYTLFYKLFKGPPRRPGTDNFLFIALWFNISLAMVLFCYQRWPVWAYWSQKCHKTQKSIHSTHIWHFFLPPEARPVRARWSQEMSYGPSMPLDDVTTCTKLHHNGSISRHNVQPHAQCNLSAPQVLSITIHSKDSDSYCQQYHSEWVYCHSGKIFFAADMILN